jgi:hypothetical protein
MNFFTREWYDRLQATASVVGGAQAWEDSAGASVWLAAAGEYARYVDGIRRSLPDNVSGLVDPLQFHDGRVMEFVVDGELARLILHTRLVRTRYGREVAIAFEGVARSSGFTEAKGRVVLYSEIMPVDPACYELCILLDRGEVSVTFARVAITSRELGR